uniref:Protein phosphatase 1 regulatory subunit 11 n=1 Tax=Nymphaea colorata TaxID=210225 RepID=A0A5K0UYF9_9MAGN
MARSSLRAVGSGATTIILEENPSPSTLPQQPQTLVLRLNRRPKKVSWKEGTVDNEFLQRKSSKKCCIFHKQKPFDEDTSDEEEENRSGDREGRHHEGCCSSSH